MNRRNFTGALLALPVLLEAKANANEEAARRRFFQPEDEAGGRWTGFRMAILLRREVPGQPCQLREIASDEVLRSGDRIQLRIQPNASGYVYILTEDQDGNHHLLFPTLADDSAANAAGAFQMMAVPQSDWLRFDDEPGIDPVTVIFSAKPVTDLETLRKRKEAALNPRDMHHLIATQLGDNQQREVEESHNGSVPALFSVAQFATESDVVMERLEFTHRPARRKA